MVSVLLLVMVMVTTLCRVTMSAITEDEVIKALNDYRGNAKIGNMKKLIKKTGSLTCVSPVDKVDVGTASVATISLEIKATAGAAKTDLTNTLGGLKSGITASQKKFSDCSSDAKCQIYFILLYYAFGEVAAKSDDCSSKGVLLASFWTRDDALLVNDPLSPALEANARTTKICSCLPTGLCEFSPTTGNDITSQLCIARPDTIKDASFLKDLNDYRAQSKELAVDTDLVNDANSKGLAKCTASINLDDGGKASVFLVKDGYSTSAAAVGLKAMLQSLNAKGDKAKFADCGNDVDCKAYLALRSDKVTKVGIAAMTCQGINYKESTLVAIVFDTKILTTDLDKQFSLLNALNVFRKGVVSSFSDLTSTTGIVTKATTEVGKCKDGFDVKSDAEVAFVTEKLAAKVTDVAALVTEGTKLLTGYKTAADGKTTQKKCDDINDAALKLKCQKFFVVIYAAYTNGAVVHKSDCSGETVTFITVAASKRATDYSSVDEKGKVPDSGTTTVAGGGSAGNSTTAKPGDGATTNKASKVFAGFGLGASLLLILSLLH